MLSPVALLAISYDVLPEQRDQYYRFWYVVGGAAVLGWLLAWVLMPRSRWGRSVTAA